MLEIKVVELETKTEPDLPPPIPPPPPAPPPPPPPAPGPKMFPSPWRLWSSDTAATWGKKGTGGQLVP